MIKTQCCKKCSEEKNVSEFYYDVGHRVYKKICRACTALRYKARSEKMISTPKGTPNYDWETSDPKVQKKREVLEAMKAICALVPWM